MDRVSWLIAAWELEEEMEGTVAAAFSGNGAGVLLFRAPP